MNGKTDKSEDNVLENQNNENMVKENGDSTKNNDINDNESEQQGKKKKKSKKRALEISEIQEEEENEPATKKKVKTDLKESNNICAPHQEEESSKFSWKNTIIEIVSKKGEISLQKLRKRVITRYMEHSNSSSSEKATSKFNKKIKKVSEISINDDKVTLT